MRKAFPDKIDDLGLVPFGRPLNPDDLAADGVDAKLRPAAKFYLDREGNMTGITRDVGRVFFGMEYRYVDKFSFEFEI